MSFLKVGDIWTLQSPVTTFDIYVKGKHISIEEILASAPLDNSNPRELLFYNAGLHGSSGDTIIVLKTSAMLFKSIGKSYEGLIMVLGAEKAFIMDDWELLQKVNADRGQE